MKVNDSTKQKSIANGKNLIRVGIISIAAAVLLAFLMIFVFSTITRRTNFYWSGALLVSGISCIVLGTKRLRLKDEHHLRKLNKEAYGAEEPEKTWDCPKCGSQNPNTTYVCMNCSYSIV